MKEKHQFGALLSSSFWLSGKCLFLLPTRLPVSSAFQPSMLSVAAATRVYQQSCTTTWREMYGLIPYRACTSVSSQRALHACPQIVRASGYYKLGGVKRPACARAILRLHSRNLCLAKPSAAGGFRDRANKQSSRKRLSLEKALLMSVQSQAIVKETTSDILVYSRPAVDTGERQRT